MQRYLASRYISKKNVVASNQNSSRRGVATASHPQTSEVHCRPAASISRGDPQIQLPTRRPLLQRGARAARPQSREQSERWPIERIAVPPTPRQSPVRPSPGPRLGRLSQRRLGIPVRPERPSARSQPSPARPEATPQETSEIAGEVPFGPSSPQNAVQNDDPSRVRRFMC